MLNKYLWDGWRSKEISQEAITIVSCREDVRLSSGGQHGVEGIDSKHIESWSRTELDNPGGTRGSG